MLSWVCVCVCCLVRRGIIHYVDSHTHTHTQTVGVLCILICIPVGSIYDLKRRGKSRAASHCLLPNHSNFLVSIVTFLKIYTHKCRHNFQQVITLQRSKPESLTFSLACGHIRVAPKSLGASSSHRPEASFH